MLDGCRAEYDLDAGTFTVWAADGKTVATTRPITEGERLTLDPLAPTRQVASLTDAVNQLILDALMGGM